MKNDRGLFVKNPNFFRIPRKKKKQIPKDTFYCYTPTSGMKFLKGGEYGYTIKLCPYFDYRKYKDMKPTPYWIDEEFLEKHGEEKEGWCKLVKCEIEDQCKSCSLKYGKL